MSPQCEWLEWLEWLEWPAQSSDPPGILLSWKAQLWSESRRKPLTDPVNSVLNSSGTGCSMGGTSSGAKNPRHPGLVSFPREKSPRLLVH